MTSRRRFIQTLAVVPPALYFNPAWAAQDPSRLALIIGNSAYQDAPLINPANDAKAMGGLFTQAGFTVDSLLDAKRTDMLAAIERFGAAAKKPETKLVVFYYAGHGTQLDWRNYLLPVDAVVKRQEDLKQRCVDLSLLLGQLSAAKDKTFIILLDACRDNPFGRAYRPEQKGLSQFDAPVGSLLAYATSPGNVASDGEGANGLYTENLMRELFKPRTRIEDAMKRVRLNVRLASKGEQIPWETTSLEGDVYLVGEGTKKLSEAELEKLVETDIAEWERIKSSTKIDDWVGYLRNFPNGRFAEIAQMRLARLLAGIEKQRFEALRQEEQARIEREQMRLAAERKRIETLDQQAAAKKTSEEKERLGLERQRLAVAERLLTDQKRLEQAKKEREERERAEVQRASAATPGTFMINIRAGLPVPQLIPPSENPFSAGTYPLGRIYSVGDERVMKMSDILTGAEERLITHTVTRVDQDADRVEFNDGLVVYDLMGNPLKDGVVLFDNPVQFNAGEFQLGKKWTAAYRRKEANQTSNGYYDLEIVKRETIAVPAGRFDTFKTEGLGYNNFGTRLEFRLWQVPGLNSSIKWEIVVRNRAGNFIRTERGELVSLRQKAVDPKLAVAALGK